MLNPELPEGDRLCDQLHALIHRIAESAQLVPWWALRPSDYDGALLAKKHLHAACIVLEALSAKP